MHRVLIYKHIDTPEGISVQFRRVDGRQIGTHFPQQLQGDLIVPKGQSVEKFVSHRVAASGWVGGQTLPFDNPVAQILLAGRW